MSQQLEYADSVESVLSKLSQLAEQKISTIPMQQNAQGVYQPQTQGQVQPYNFNEQLLDTKSNTSVLGEAIGAGLSGTVYGLTSGFLPGMAAMSPGLITAGAGWAIGKYLLKNGFGHSIARGVMIAGITTFVAPMVAGIAGSLGGAGA